MHKNQLQIEKKIAAVLGESPQLLPGKKLQKYVSDFFDHKDHYLKAFEKFGSPLYMIEPQLLKNKAMGFRNAFETVLPDVRFYYAVKSNNHPEISKRLLTHGFGLDVSSGVELEMALSLGADDIVFSGPGKTPKELLLAATHSRKVTVLMDSFGELKRLEAAASACDTEIRAGVRLTTNPKGLWRKFGILPNALISFWEAAKAYPHINLCGLQFHTSWNMTPEKQVRFIKDLSPMLSLLPADFRQDIEFIDIGGGYWPSEGEWLTPYGTTEGMFKSHLGIVSGTGIEHYYNPADSIDVFASRISEAIKTHIFPIVDCQICFEPGRWVCNDAMHLLMTVVDRKAFDLVITDAGTNTIGWERYESDYCPVLNLSRPKMEEKKCMVLGSLCTPHDVWGYSYWGEEIEAGDVLMIPTQGAYTYSLRQNFIKPLPDAVIL